MNIISLLADRPMKGLNGKGEDSRPIFVKETINQEEYCLIAVCDGMGGKGSKQVTIGSWGGGETNTHAHFASKKLHDILIETFAEAKRTKANPIDFFKNYLRYNIEKGFESLPSDSSDVSSLKGKMTAEFPTTLCAFVFNVNNIAENKIFWAGDSRLYAIFEKQIVPITQDHVDNPSIYPVVSKPLKRNIQKGEYAYEEKTFNPSDFNYGALLGFFVTTDGLIDGYQSPIELNLELLKALTTALTGDGGWAGSKYSTNFAQALLNQQDVTWSDDVSVSLVLLEVEGFKNKLQNLYGNYGRITSPLYVAKTKHKDLETELSRSIVKTQKYEQEIAKYEAELASLRK